VDLTGKHRSSRHKRRWIFWIAISLLTALTLAGTGISLLYRHAEPFVRARIVAALEERFHARVELDSFHLSLLDGLQAEGHGLRIWPPAEVSGISVPATSAQPIIRLAEFHFRSPLRFQPGKPFHIALVELNGLDLHLPPRSHFNHAAAPMTTSKVALHSFQLDAIQCVGATITLETDKPGKLPQEFALSRLQLTNIAAAGALSFAADLSIPRPQGAVHAEGSFGPWKNSDPGESPVKGSYRLEHADLASFKDIAGMLNSTGSYQGTMRDLIVDGQTDTPDFRLTAFNNALPLHTNFHAIVDGTNGDTRLEPVNAMLGRSPFTASGQIVRVPDPANPSHSLGHDIALRVTMSHARIEDFLRLTSHSNPPLLAGSLASHAALHIPPGSAPIHRRMSIDGSFNLDQSHFSSPKIQDGIAQLSLRGQGHPDQIKTTDPSAVLSTMQGDFHLAGGMLALPAMTYSVPGADIQTHGNYGLDAGTLDFTGTARLQATVSEMVGGWTGMLLKPADSFFKKHGAGVELPFHVGGSREDPQFSVDFAGRTFKLPSRAKDKQ
jgi:hypothetical protein